MRARFVLLASLALIISVVLGGSAGAAVSPSVAASKQIVVSGLDNPRDLAFGNGKLYVAEAGHGGTACFTIPQQGKQCVGFTSGVSRINIAGKSATRVVSGLFSIAGADGTFATGVDGISIARLQDLRDRDGCQPVGSSGDRAGGCRGQGEEADRPGDRCQHRRRLEGDRQRRRSRLHLEQPITSGSCPGSSPTRIPTAFSGQGVRRWWSMRARIRSIGSRPPTGCMCCGSSPIRRLPTAVPTCLDKGPDGAIYIGELTGGGNAPGSSVVWRFAPGTNTLTKWATGLTTVTGCGFGPDGKFYATEFSTAWSRQRGAGYGPGGSSAGAQHQPDHDHRWALLPRRVRRGIGRLAVCLQLERCARNRACRSTNRLSGSDHASLLGGGECARGGPVGPPRRAQAVRRSGAGRSADSVPANSSTAAGSSE